MGSGVCACVREKGREDELDNEELRIPEYEVLCQEMEKRLVFAKVDIKLLEAEVDQIEPFSLESVKKLFKKHGVSEETFTDVKGIYQEFLSDMDTCEDYKFYLLSIGLTFCKGNTKYKRVLLWKLMQDVVNTERYNNMVREIISRNVMLAMKVVPMLIVKACQKQGKEVNHMIKSLSELPVPIINGYTELYFPEEETPKTYKKSSSARTFYKCKFDSWLSKVDMEGFMSSQYLREAYMRMIGKDSM